MLSDRALRLAGESLAVPTAAKDSPASLKARSDSIDERIPQTPNTPSKAKNKVAISAHPTEFDMEAILRVMQSVPVKVDHFRPV
jgi:hypothetical protein